MITDRKVPAETPAQNTTLNEAIPNKNTDDWSTDTHLRKFRKLKVRRKNINTFAFVIQYTFYAYINFKFASLCSGKDFTHVLCSF